VEPKMTQSLSVESLRCHIFVASDVGWWIVASQ